MTYTTTQGDTFDGIAFKLYGDEGYMKDLIEANWKHADTLLFSAGVVLTVPEVQSSTTSENAPFWRDSEDTDGALYESEDTSEDLTDEESEDDEEE